MGCVLSKEKIKIKNILPKNHEIASTSGEITLRKDENFDILCFQINWWIFANSCSSLAYELSMYSTTDSWFYFWQ